MIHPLAAPTGAGERATTGELQAKDPEAGL